MWHQTWGPNPIQGTPPRLARRTSRGAGANAPAPVFTATPQYRNNHSPHDPRRSPPAAGTRADGQKRWNESNFKEAYAIFSRLALDPKTDPEEAADDLFDAVNGLNALGQITQVDDLLEKAIAAHAGNWRVLARASQIQQTVPHQGFIVSGKFIRGYNSDKTGKPVFTEERDRVRALQLLVQAMPLVDKAKPDEAGPFYYMLAQFFVSGRGPGGAWQLVDATDLTNLPDYEEAPAGPMYGRGFRGRGYYGGYRQPGEDKGAPVNPDGGPVLHKLPASWDEATTDGQRWRWCLARSGQAGPNHADQADLAFAHFMHQQLGVQTMLNAGYRGVAQSEEGEDGKKNEAGPFAVRTLSDEETIARLATGIKRFAVPDEYNALRIYRRLLGKQGSPVRHNAGQALASAYLDRQQYDAAAKVYRDLIALNDENLSRGYREQLDQIEKPWGRFEQVASQPAGVKPTFDYRFRNGNKVTFTAFQLNERKLLEDTQTYIEAHKDAKNVKWEMMQVGQVGYRVLNNGQKEYLGEKVAEWDVALQPREAHFDRRITVAAPLAKAGAYMVTAKMADGNECHAVLWVADTILVKKPLDGGKSFLFVADAMTGRGVPNAKLNYFGYRQRWVNDEKNHNSYPVIDTLRLEGAADEKGQCVFDPGNDEARQQYQWIITANAPEGRFAFLGFTSTWAGNYRDYEYNEHKSIFISDRPVYRPGQTVQFKFWLARTQYDQQGPSQFAGAQVQATILDPKGEKVLEKVFSADEFGGIAGQLELPQGATLGVYTAFVGNAPQRGTFRVEEYKKPEFEVSVDAPTTPLELGEKFTATVTAKYLFGAPVANAKVKYKVMRSAHTASWYPASTWDWMYGSGYWWFGCDYRWYPGWGEWGCARPVRAWWPWWRAEAPPELVAEAEAPLLADGTLKIEIDTALAKAIHGDEDHRYEVTAEVTDASRRMIVGQGTVLVARKPFKVYAWVDRGYYRAGDVVRASFSATTLDRKPVAGKGTLRLLRLTYEAPDNLPKETEVERWPLDPDAKGGASLQIKAAKPGQYRLSYKLSAAEGKQVIEGGYVFCVLGEGANAIADANQGFRFNDIELVPDKRDYQPGESVDLHINTARADAWVLLFVRPTYGIYLAPKLLELKGKSAAEAIAIQMKDMPNFFVEACTVSGGKVYSETREIAVPPASRVLDVKVTPSAQRYKPGEKASVAIQLTDPDGKPFVGSTVVSMYDKAVEYISGGTNVPEIRAHFWKWARQHNPRTESNDSRSSASMTRPGERAMGDLGAFGFALLSDEMLAKGIGGGGGGGFATSFASTGVMAGRARGQMKNSSNLRGQHQGEVAAAAAPMMEAESDSLSLDDSRDKDSGKKERANRKSNEEAGGEPDLVEPAVRSNFADTAFWSASVKTDAQGMAKIELTMPENLTGWTTRVWAMGAGSRVGQGDAQVVTSKDLLVRLQAPRFFVEKDQVVLSANVHNYLDAAKSVKVALELDGPVLKPMDGLVRTVKIPAKGEARVDWRVRVAAEGQAVVRMKALSDAESDAMQLTFPAYVHGMLKTESFTGSIPASAGDNDAHAAVALRVPAERRPEQTRLEVRYSPTLAGAMVDALPYLVDYPYGCTEQTLSRFLPTVITQRILQKIGVDLRDIQKKRTNLNAQEIGDDAKRAEDWKRLKKARNSEEQNPVFDIDVVRDMSKAGVSQLMRMQCADGGWGWFSGIGEQSYPHTTAYVVHGLQIARENDVAVPDQALARGIDWLNHYRDEQLTLLRNAEEKERDKRNLRWKQSTDDLDAFVYMVLVDAGKDSKAMQDFLYRDRGNLSVYSMSMFGMALHRLQAQERLAMVLRNIGQFLQQDDENQTAYLKLPNERYWWCWYGSTNEANAYYLKLLSRTDPKGAVAPKLVKYLLNNRRNPTWWNSTRDTALCIEALADYLKASGEDKPDMKLQVLLDGKPVKEVTINAANLFTFDNKLVLEGPAVATGNHKVELVRTGKGPVYFNAYLTNFTLEDPITRAGLEVKVNRSFFKLVREEKSVKAQGSRGQSVDQRVEKYRRVPLENLAKLKSGDLVEVEMTIDSKNDYEYLLFEDMKPAGFEPVEVRSGYNGNELGAYVEFRDERVAFFVRQIMRGTHSVSYRLRAETPGLFSALPARASAMYAPELRGNSDEMKLGVED
ncbi:MAG: MG2 domain-containing protein [Planctomycetota bacterium]|nr:MG2 domain-containing protein [Planctomycetota bacterium]